ncbi:PLD nuclease N-terminal domain-containing protein [Zafaria sp. Z1313]|uniref:PLD nuclease N-terminal domain-containing protein n=1 Tax=unclassified Zafaria TaxID=2828765 RepID=UPI002E7A43AB|nr:PLD nuclease N-terminal domain-containing protein [Zafaria sp. J156]MEE1621705.1 PLD nuclease N-terminal domain-containing protein [Zafaria sp. J156]
MGKKKWSEIPPKARWRIAVVATAQIALQGYVLRDIARRPRSEVRGPKPAWVAASFLNFIGPVAYLFFGRRNAA